MTDFVAELGIVFLLFFLGLEFSLSRSRGRAATSASAARSTSSSNLGLGLIVGVAAFGFTFAALVLAACVYVSSSAIAVKGLIDFRRLGDDETDLVLAILVFEDIVDRVHARLRRGGRRRAVRDARPRREGARLHHRRARGLALALEPIDRLLDRLPLEFFLLAIFGFLVGSAAIADELGLSEAIGALMAGIVLSETTVRDQIEERFFSFRDIFAALFFFVFGLSIDVGAIADVGWLVALAVVLTLVGKLGGGHGRRAASAASRAARASTPASRSSRTASSRSSSRSSRPRTRWSSDAGERSDLVAFAGLYVLVDRDDRDRPDEGVEAARPRRLFPAPRLTEEH